MISNSVCYETVYNNHIVDTGDITNTSGCARALSKCRPPPSAMLTVLQGHLQHVIFKVLKCPPGAACLSFQASSLFIFPPEFHPKPSQMGTRVSHTLRKGKQNPIKISLPLLLEHYHFPETGVPWLVSSAERDGHICLSSTGMESVRMELAGVFVGFASGPLWLKRKCLASISPTAEAHWVYL